MTDILLAVLIILIIIMILLVVFRKSGTDNSKIIETIKLLGDMISKNQKDTDEYQSKKFNEIDKNISTLRIEREALMCKRTSLFESLDITCEVKYEFVSGKYIGRDCRFYIELEGRKEILLECGVYSEEIPDDIWLKKVPNKYKNDVIMLWKKAHLEDVEYFNRYNTEWSKRFEQVINTCENSEDNKEFYKRCFRILAKNFHPDNSEEDMENMKKLNQLKVMWGV